MEVFRNDVKAGLFIVIGFTLLLIAIFKVGGFMEQFEDHNEVTLNFEDAQQVKSGTVILLRGMEVGKVRNVALAPDAKSVNMTCRLTGEVMIPEGTRARVAAKSMLGGKIIELVLPAVENHSGVMLPQGATIPGMPANGIETTIELVNSMLTDYRGRLDQLIVDVTDLVEKFNLTADDARSGINSLTGLRDQVDQTLASYKNLAEELDQQVGKLTTQASSLLASAEGTSEAMEADIKKLTDELTLSAKEIKTQMTALLANSNKMVSNTDGMISENREDIATTLQTLERTLKSLESFSAQIDRRPSSLLWGRAKKDK